MEVNIYGFNPTTFKRRVLVRSPLPSISLPSCQLKTLIFPAFCNLPAATSVISGIFSASDDALMCPIRMTEFHKAVSKTISVNIISSVSPGQIFSLTESGLFSMPEFDFFDLGPRLQSSPPTRAHGPFLSLKPGVEPSLFVPTDQAKEFQQSHLFRARVNDNL